MMQGYDTILPRDIHSNPQLCEDTPHVRLRRFSAGRKTKTGHPPRQRLNSPDHKLPVTEVAMAVKANTSIPAADQHARYRRAVPIGHVVHNILSRLSERVEK